MTVHMENALIRLRKRLADLASAAEDQVRGAVLAFESRDRQLAERVIANDVKIDKTEVEIEEECLQVLALYQPVADDLRLVVSILKINNDLERTSDYAVTIAERTIFLADQQLPVKPIDFGPMADRAINMLHRSIDALIARDSKLALEICRADTEVDRIHQENYNTVDEMVQKHPASARNIMQFVTVSRCLERIADQATNIAEDVIYLVDGRIVRHDATTRGY